MNDEHVMNDKHEIHSNLYADTTENAFYSYL